ncbi:helix-turn-helix domain-containing protein [Gemmatimonas sp.]|uniref:helix-turn-helix domain-containing protein n=1 Tax=Gemmatimonas sp. TaxID=1962908 RepID=UPI00356A33BB
MAINDRRCSSSRFGDTPGWDERVVAETDAAVIAEQVYALRKRHGLTQSALAKRINSAQSAIARMEHAEYRGHSTSVLQRIAAAVGEQVSVRFVSKTAAGSAQGASSATPSPASP